MLRVPIFVIADDLTGAAEIAAIGHRHGLSASVVSEIRTLQSKDDLVIFDTDSRLDPASLAAEKIAALVSLLQNRPHALLYKKVDSVLRGSVRAELEALALGFGFSRCLLVPANPALGRTVRDGRYSVDGVPLHETAFARDPHHPATTDEVCERLGRAGAFPVTVGSPQDPFLSAGIVIGNAASSADINTWAQRTVPGTLLAGAGEFFAALLRARGLAGAPPSDAFTAGSPVLVISGTTSPAGAALRENARGAGVPITPMPATIPGVISDWAGVVQTQLAATGRALAVCDGPVSTDPQVATAIRQTFALLVRELVARAVVHHIIVEGGATAAAVTRALGWHELRLLHEWGPGVASLRPACKPLITLTLKPGSYAWPPALWEAVVSPRRPLPSPMSSASLPLVAITMGDAAGTGPEIITKSLALPELRLLCRPVVIGDAATMTRALRFTGAALTLHAISDVAEARSAPGEIDVLDLANIDLAKLQLGRVDSMAGHAAYEYIKTATELALAGKVAAIVTSAINKESLNQAGHRFDGHTGLLAQLCQAPGATMMLVADKLRVSHVSTHVPLRVAIERVKPERILKVLQLTHEAVRRLGLEKPRLAVAGLNPHAGEHGLFGDEEEKFIAPAIAQAQALGLDVHGPFAGDTIFFRTLQGEFDAAVAMYHDQGHVAAKMLGIWRGVNVTLGLPIIRTSVEHGTDFANAGTGRSDPRSLNEAIKLAAALAKPVS